jgi:hypothetical protein
LEGRQVKALQRRQSRGIADEAKEMHHKGGRGEALQEKKMKSIARPT